MSKLDEMREKRYRRAVAGGNSLLVVLPFFLTVVCIMMIIFSFVYFHEGAEEKKLLIHKEAAEDIVSNRGEAWNDWTKLWSIEGMTWEQLEQPFEKVQQDWESRGLPIDWEYMTNVFNHMRGRITVQSFEAKLFAEIISDFAPYVNPTQSFIIATVLLVLGIIIGAVLVIRFLMTGTFAGMFCS